jgi:uncharacterized RDD family membrane protein YckC
MLMQEFWGKRTVALIIDVIFITLFMWALTAILYPLIALTNLYFVFNFWFILWGFITLAYFTLMEGKWSTTLGKGLMKLKVQAIQGDMNYQTALMRNLSKFLWIPLLIDVTIGFIGAKANKRRYLDDIANTRIILLE